MLSLVVNAVTANSLQITFNGVLVYTVNAMGAGNTIYGSWIFTGNAMDSSVANT